MGPNKVTLQNLVVHVRKLNCVSCAGAPHVVVVGATRSELIGSKWNGWSQGVHRDSASLSLSLTWWFPVYRVYQ